MGFGVYREIVQMLESAEHWDDVGYDVLTGPLVQGQPVHIRRPDRNSPIQVPAVDGFPLIEWHQAVNVEQECEWVVGAIQRFIDGGLAPEEILVISLDDRHARAYLATIAEQLALRDIASNNIIADPYNEPPFTISGKVSLSTVYRAKGNEAAVVFAVGVNSIETRTRGGRNKVFTAFTRTKAWLQVSGLGEPAQRFFEELATAWGKAPDMQFVMPDLAAKSRQFREVSVRSRPQLGLPVTNTSKVCGRLACRTKK